MVHGISYTCRDCAANFTTTGGLQRHRNSAHRQFTPASEGEDDNTFKSYYHPKLNDGHYLPPLSVPPPLPPPPVHGQDPAAWAPFGSRAEFDFAQFHFVKLQSSAANINTALDLWAASVMQFGGTVPWKNSDELYATIDKIQSGHMPWQTYRMRYTGPLPPGTAPRWMTQTYEICTRDLRAVLHHQLETTSFKGDIDMVPYRQFNHAGKRVWSNLMSGDWAWNKRISWRKTPITSAALSWPSLPGATRPLCLSPPDTKNITPVYASPGNLTGPARRAHGNGLLPVAFLAIPKSLCLVTRVKKHRSKPAYQKFCRQMYHASLALIYQPLRPFMETPDIVRCPDGHFRRVIYSIGPYIADYPEQVWLAAVVQNWCPKCEAHPDDLDADGARLRTQTKTEALVMCFDPGILWDEYGIRADIVPFTNDFPRADIYELLSSDLLHQVIKGTFKDHIVSWVNEYLHDKYGEKRALEIIQDIDRRISAVPEFPGLRRFPDGRDFSQWTGDDSKALMKIYLAAVAGYLPSDMIKCLSAFMEFCYPLPPNFITCGVRVAISLPRQHSLKHYIRFIRLFGSPNGLCSSITESKHIKAVKEPWRRSSRFNALSQMLQTLVRLDKLAALKVVLTLRGMMTGTIVLAGEQPQVDAAEAAAALDDDEDDDGLVHGPKSLSDIQLAPTPQRGYPKTLQALAAHIQQPQLPALLRRFLQACPVFAGRIIVHHSAVARFYAPSDLGGAGGMYRERIRSNPNWHGYSRRDTVLVDAGAAVMRGLVIGRVLLFFSFTFAERSFECALVNWLVPVGDAPDPDTGMWVVELERCRRVPTLAIIPVDSIARGAHLIGVYGTAALPEDFHFSDSLDAFNTYFVNPYADHHMHEFLS
ncbi:hypothetical protein B0H14DRAFT_3092899 [Mycena olivaceomarginata]|nr:hypothetical protein B0H14DRAFT_3092899 [Mycena olivaceomarginata]